MKSVGLVYQYFFTEDCKLCADAEVLTWAILPLALRKANHSVLQADAYSALEKTRPKFVLPRRHLPILLQDSVESLEKVCTLVQTGLKSGTHNWAQYSQAEEPGGVTSWASCRLYAPVCLSRYGTYLCQADLRGELFPGYAFVKGHFCFAFWGKTQLKPVHCFCHCSQKRMVKWAQGTSGQDSSLLLSSLWEWNNSQINANHGISTRASGLIIWFQEPDVSFDPARSIITPWQKVFFMCNLPHVGKQKKLL